MTTIELGDVGGMSDYGRKTPAEMIALYRRYAEYNLAQARATILRVLQRKVFRHVA